MSCFADFLSSALNGLTAPALCVKRNKCHQQTFSDDYSQECMIYNETGIDIILTVVYQTVSLKHDGPTGQTTGQRGSDSSALLQAN